MSFKSFVSSVLGPSWKTSLAGYSQLFAVTAYQGYEALNGKELTSHDVVTILVSAGVALGLRVAKDHGVAVSDSVASSVTKEVSSVIESKLPVSSASHKLPRA